MLMISCGTFGKSKKTTTRTTTNKPVKKPTTKSSPVDTISWTKVSETEKSPIGDKELEPGEEPLPDSEKSASYKVSILIPFEANNFNFNTDEIDPEGKQHRFINFYAGVKMALNQLEASGMALEVNVFDTKNSVAEVGELLLKKENREADVIIGPYNRECLKLVADFGKRKKITVVSPWQSSSKITEKNPYYIQLRPSLSAHYQKVTSDVKEHFSNEQVVLLGRNSKSDLTRFKYFQQAARAIDNSKESKPFEEYIIIEDSLSYGDTAFDSTFFQTGPKVFILPNWSFAKDEDFIYSVVRRLNVEKGLSQVYLYGMPILLESEKINFDYYKNLNMRVCRSKFVDLNQTSVLDFKRSYYNTYGALPSEDAYEGYDVMMMVGNSLKRYGKYFHFKMGTNSSGYLQTGYDVQVKQVSRSDNFGPENIQYYENRHLDIVKFENNKFVRSK